MVVFADKWRWRAVVQRVLFAAKGDMDRRPHEGGKVPDRFHDRAGLRRSMRAAALRLLLATSLLFVAVPLQALECPAPQAPVLSLDMSGYYADQRHSIRDPDKFEENGEATRPLATYLTQIARLSDSFVASGSPDERACAVGLLRSWASNDALAGKRFSTQGEYNRAWALAGLGLSAIKLKIDAGEPEIAAWFGRIAEKTIAYRDWRREREGENGATNLDYWAGMAVGAAGVVSNRRDLWEFGAAAYKRAMNTIDASGTFPVEMKRGQRATAYQAFAAQPLVVLARLAPLMNDDLYHPDHAKFDLLVDTILAAKKDPQLLAQRANAVQMPLADLYWLGLYWRMRDPAVADSLPWNERSDFQRRLGGRTDLLDQVLPWP